jgi:hypothetical protein
MFKDNKNIKTVEVFNMMGELVLSQGNAKIINLQAFPKGIYIARINGEFVNCVMTALGHLLQKFDTDSKMKNISTQNND